MQMNNDGQLDATNDQPGAACANDATQDEGPQQQTVPPAGTQGVETGKPTRKKRRKKNKKNKVTGWRSGEVLPPVITGRALRAALRGLKKPCDPVPNGPLADGSLRCDLDRAWRRPLVLDRAVDISAAQVSWLWPGRVPLRRLTLVAGEPGSAASLVAIDLAARVSHGAGWPAELMSPDPAQAAQAELERAQAAALNPREALHFESSKSILGAPVKVMYFARQDDLAETVVPGLARAGADLDSVVCADGVFLNQWDMRLGRTRPLMLPGDFHSLRQAIRALPGLRLVVLDPIEAFIPGALHHPQRRNPEETALAIRALVELSRELEVAIVGVAEMKCRSRQRLFSGELRHRMLESAAHLVWGVAHDREDADQSWLFSLKRCQACDETPLVLKQTGSKLDWSRALEEAATEPAARKQDSQTARTTRKEMAAAWLRRQLWDGARLASEILELAKEVGFCERLLCDARAEIGVQVKKDSFRGKSWWSLPASPEQASRRLFEPLEAFNN